MKSLTGRPHAARSFYILIFYVLLLKLYTVFAFCSSLFGGFTFRRIIDIITSPVSEIKDFERAPRTLLLRNHYNGFLIKR